MDKLKQHKERIIIILLIASLTWAAVSTFLFFSDYGRLHRSGFMPGPHAWRPHHAPTPNDIDRIQPWMTFAFVNNIYKLPPEFLRDKLAIHDTKYPNLSIMAGAKAGATSSDALLTQLKKILKDQMVLSAGTTTPL